MGREDVAIAVGLDEVFLLPIFLVVPAAIIGTIRSHQSSVEEALPHDYFTRAPLPWDAAFLAAKVFERYRRGGGTRTTALPDFFIGAHAAVAGMTLLTRDARRYRTYFPKLKLIAP